MDTVDKREITSVRVGGGVSIRYDNRGWVEHTDGVLYALEAISVERMRLQERLQEIDAAEAALRRKYRDVFVDQYPTTAQEWRT